MASRSCFFMASISSRVAHQRTDIDGGLGSFNGADIILKSRVVKVALFAQQVHGIGRFAGQGDRAGADAAVTHNNGSDALGNLGAHLRGFNDMGIVVGVDIDKAGGEE